MSLPDHLARKVNCKHCGGLTWVWQILGYEDDLRSRMVSCPWCSPDGGYDVTDEEKWPHDFTHPNDLEGERI